MRPTSIRFRTLSGLAIVLTLVASACTLSSQSNAAPTIDAGTPVDSWNTIISLKGVPHALAIDDAHIYWSILGPLNEDGSWNTKVIDGSIMRANKDGTDALVLASGLYPPWAMAVDASSVYWIAANGVEKVSKEGGMTTVLARWKPPDLPYTPEIELTQDIAVDDINVYWTMCTDQITKLEKSSNSVTVLASGRDCPSHIAIDADNIYWTELGDDGALMRELKDGTRLTQLLSHQGLLLSFTKVC